MVSYLTVEDFNNWKPSKIDAAPISCIYLIKIKNKEYIGLTKNLFKRIKYHISDINKRAEMPLYKNMKRVSFSEQKVFILHSECDISILKELEKKEISERSTLFPNGLNSNAGGG